MKIKTISSTLLILLILGLIGYRISKSGNENENGPKNTGPKTAQQAEGIIIKTENFSDFLSLSGAVEANEQVEIRSEISGIVESIYFQEGTVVSKGQALLKINDLELKAQLSQAITRQNLASENERRAKLLLTKEAISQEEYDIASSEFRSLKAQTQLIQAQIAKTTVRAPFSGNIGLRSISPGTYVTPTTLISKLVNTDVLKITFSIPEKYSSNLQPNTKVSFTVPNQTETFEATIYAVESEIETTTRTLRIRAKIANTSGKILPGTFATVNLPLTAIADAILIPTEAIIPVQNGKKVILSKNGKATEVLIATGTRSKENILVLQGLQVGDTLVTSGIMSIKKDAPIQVKVK
jgi:membrane fusion protein (multidrug efflux system)